MHAVIAEYHPDHRHQLLALSLRAWKPVFAEMKHAVPPYVYQAFYPKGWEDRQSQEIEAFLQDAPEAVLVASMSNTVVGWVGTRLHPEDRMGEIYILAVEPSYQRQGVAKALLEAAGARLRDAGMAMVMVETGGDPGHAASRHAYENAGFERWPVARYFKQL
jgi:ribosomal protein S18 acetylase RimI-like enzyme